MKLKIKAVSDKIGKDIPYPFYATAGAAAMDLCACVDAPVEVAPRALVSIPTGIAIALPSAEYVALVFARSGLASSTELPSPTGWASLTATTRGEIRVGLTNLSDTPYTVQPGDASPSWPSCPWVQAELERVDSLDDTGRGDRRLRLHRKVRADAADRCGPPGRVGAGLVPARGRPQGPPLQGRHSEPMQAAWMCRGGRPHPPAKEHGTGRSAAAAAPLRPIRKGTEVWRSFWPPSRPGGGSFWSAWG